MVRLQMDQGWRKRPGTSVPDVGEGVLELLAVLRLGWKCFHLKWSEMSLNFIPEMLNGTVIWGARKLRQKRVDIILIKKSGRLLYSVSMYRGLYKFVSGFVFCVLHMYVSVFVNVCSISSRTEFFAVLLFKTTFVKISSRIFMDI